MLDQEIFSSSEGKLLKTAQLRRLIRDKDFYSGEFDQHTSTIDEVPESSPIVGHASQKNGSEIEPLTIDELKRAAKRASEFVRKITPSALDSEVPADVRTRSRLDTLATLYGRWWHKFFQASGLERWNRFRTKVIRKRIADFSRRESRGKRLERHAPEFVQRRHHRSFSCER